MLQAFYNLSSRCRKKINAEGAEMRREKTISGFDTCTSLDAQTVNQVKLQNREKNLNTTGQLITPLF